MLNAVTCYYYQRKLNNLQFRIILLLQWGACKIDHWLQNFEYFIPKQQLEQWNIVIFGHYDRVFFMGVVFGQKYSSLWRHHIIT